MGGNCGDVVGGCGAVVGVRWGDDDPLLMLNVDVDDVVVISFVVVLMP